MTYEEIKARLVKVETALTALQTGSYQHTSFNFDVKETVTKLKMQKQSLQEQLTLLEQTTITESVRVRSAISAKLAEVQAIVKTKKGDEALVDVNPSDSAVKNDPNIASITTTAGQKIKEASTLKEDWGSSDQSAMNHSIHRDLGEPTSFPGLSQLLDAAEESVDFYWNDWEEYETDREGLVAQAAHAYLRSYFPEMYKQMIGMFGEAVDMNDPVLMKFRAAAAKRMSEKERLAAHPERDTIKATQALMDRERKLAALHKYRAQVMRDMEQEAEPEGGAVADKYGDELNKIDAAIAKLSEGEEKSFADYSNNELAAYCKNTNDPEAKAELKKRVEKLKALTNEDHSSDPNAKYEVKPCDKKDEPWAVWEGDVRVKGFKSKEEAQAYADKQNKEQGLAEATKEEETKFHKELDTLVHKTFGKRKEEINEAPEGTFYIEVSIRDARKALELVDNMYRNELKLNLIDMNGSNVYYINDEETAYNLYTDFSEEGIEILDTNVTEEGMDSFAQDDADYRKFDMNEVAEGTQLPTASDEILAKFPTVKKALVSLLTDQYGEFVDEVEWIAPKPSTFRIKLHNGESFELRWTGTGFQATIAGKKYYLTNVDEFQQALDKLGEILKTKKMEGEPTDGDLAGLEGGDEEVGADDFEEPTGDEETL